MTIQEKRERLQTLSSVIAYPTVVTSDMGLQYDIFTCKGYATNMGDFSLWPAREIPKDSIQDLINLIEDAATDSLTFKDFEDTEFYEFISNEEDIISIVNFIKSHKQQLPSRIFILATPCEALQIFDTKEKLESTFIEQYFHNYIEWADVDDATITYLYDNAVCNEWKLYVE